MTLTQRQIDTLNWLADNHISLADLSRLSEADLTALLVQVRDDLAGETKAL